MPMSWAWSPLGMMRESEMFTFEFCTWRVYLSSWQWQLKGLGDFGIHVQRRSKSSPFSKALYVYMCVCIYAHTYICVYICICICVCMIDVYYSGMAWELISWYWWWGGWWSQLIFIDCLLCVGTVWSVLHVLTHLILTTNKYHYFSILLLNKGNFLSFLTNFSSVIPKCNQDESYSLLKLS